MCTAYGVFNLQTSEPYANSLKFSPRAWLSRPPRLSCALRWDQSSCPESPFTPSAGPSLRAESASSKVTVCRLRGRLYTHVGMPPPRTFWGQGLWHRRWSALKVACSALLLLLLLSHVPCHSEQLRYCTAFTSNRNMLSNRKNPSTVC